MSVVQKLFPSNVDLVDIVVESKQEGVSCTLSVSTKFWLQPLTQIICSRLDSCAPESNGYSFQEHLNTLSLVASMPDGPELLTNSASLQKLYGMLNGQVNLLQLVLLPNPSYNNQQLFLLSLPLMTFLQTAPALLLIVSTISPSIILVTQ